MRARPREHYRNDTITSSGSYRNPSIVNAGVQSKPKAWSYDEHAKYLREQQIYLDREKQLKDEGERLKKKAERAQWEKETFENSAVGIGAVAGTATITGGASLLPTAVGVGTVVANAYRQKRNANTEKMRRDIELLKQEK